jgi:hypothetical protein
VSALAVVLFGSVCVAADDAAKSQPGDGARAARAASTSEKGAKPQAAARGSGQSRASRLTKPWRDMASLSEEQKKQIASIHRKAVQDKSVIEEREKADIMALLNDQQKGELKAMQEKDAAQRKARAGTAAPANESGAAANDSGAAAERATGASGGGGKSEGGE